MQEDGKNQRIEVFDFQKLDLAAPPPPVPAAKPDAKPPPRRAAAPATTGSPKARRHERRDSADRNSWPLPPLPRRRPP